MAPIEATPKPDPQKRKFGNEALLELLNSIENGHGANNKVKIIVQEGVKPRDKKTEWKEQ